MSIQQRSIWETGLAENLQSIAARLKLQIPPRAISTVQEIIIFYFCFVVEKQITNRLFFGVAKWQIHQDCIQRLGIGRSDFGSGPWNSWAYRMIKRDAGRWSELLPVRRRINIALINKMLFFIVILLWSDD